MEKTKVMYAENAMSFMLQTGEYGIRVTSGKEDCNKIIRECADILVAVAKDTDTVNIVLKKGLKPYIEYFNSLVAIVIK